MPRDPHGDDDRLAGDRKQMLKSMAHEIILLLFCLKSVTGQAQTKGPTDGCSIRLVAVRRNSLLALTPCSNYPPNQSIQGVMMIG